MPEQLNLSNLKPAQARKDRKRVGRGLGSGKGRYSGRGIKGQKSRSGSHKMRAGFEGGQMPIYMRMPKQRGSTSKDAKLDRFDDGTEVTLEALVEAGVIKNTKTDVKILGNGELKKKLTVSAHAFSKSAREKIEGAGGTVNWLRGEPVEKKPKKQTKKPAPDVESPEPEAAPEAAETSEPEASEA